ncbi:MAG: HlyU family transcriptional regulator [Xanthobacteraceae bacterium]|nr:HlyU family transcriptional regulator [Xanthobacteraceae bacterium]
MSLVRALFGGPRSGEGEKVSEPVEYKGFLIRAAPYKSEGRYQTAGVIEREIGGERKEHRFIRADAFASYEDAVQFSLAKARQLVDLQGERMFG